MTTNGGSQVSHEIRRPMRKIVCIVIPSMLRCHCIFSAVTEYHPSFRVGLSLAGILMDWSDTQLHGLTGAVGCEVAESVTKGCQVFT